MLSYSLRFGFNDVQPGDRVAVNVFMVWEMIRPLLRGATTFCVPDSVSYDPMGLVKVLIDHDITETCVDPRSSSVSSLTLVAV